MKFLSSKDFNIMWYSNVVILTGDWDMKQPGVTALAHPLDTKVASRHGVFVFENIEEIRRRYREGIMKVAVL